MSLDKAGCVPLNGRMKTRDLSPDAIRRLLLDRADAFSKKHNVSLSRIGVEALNDSKFLSEVRTGRNFTIESYGAVMGWIDAEEARRKAGEAA